MALLFSRVTLRANNGEAVFLTCGTPKSAEDLENYTAFQEFLDGLDDKTVINTTAESLLYGDGEVFEADINEVAYFTIRQSNDGSFLSRCEKVGESTFSFTHSPTDHGFSHLIGGNYDFL